MDEAIAEDCNRCDAENCAVDRADTAEDARSAKNYSSNGIEFVARAGVGFRLAEARSVNDRGERSDEASEDVCQGNPPFNGNAGVAGAFGRETNRAEATAEGGAMDEDEDEDENWRLSGNAEKTFLAEEQEPRREIGEGVHAVSDRLRETAEERIGAECDDERRKTQRSDERGVESARQSADAKRKDNCQWDWKMSIPPEFAKEDRA